MIVMLGIVSVFYFTTLILICFYREHINIKVANTLFVIADLILFFCWNLAGYQKGWLEKGFMTLENISPMVCTMIPLTCFMGEKTKNFCYSMVAFLAFGMFCALYISPEQAYLFNFNERANFVYTSEALCHMVCSLFGVYLVLTGQVKVDVKHWLKSIAFTYAIVLYGVFLNFVFHKSFFGMNPYGNASIYFIDIFGSFEATLAGYLLGILLVLTLGMQAVGGLHRLVVKREKAAHMPAAEATPEAAVAACADAEDSPATDSEN